MFHLIRLLNTDYILTDNNPGRFDGVFDSTTESKVSEFQEFYGLTGIGLVTKGKVNVSTMKSLLTSKGDTNRAAKACDCATVLNKQQALDIKKCRVYSCRTLSDRFCWKRTYTEIFDINRSEKH